MKHCMLCGLEKEQVSTLVVPPATWNQFNNFATVCAECQAIPKNRTRLRLAPAKAAAGKAASEAAAEAAPAGPQVTISHRRTGAVLHQVAGNSLQQADLSGAKLGGADLQHATLNQANLQKSDLRLADLTGADLRGADLRGASLRGADLRDTDLRGARLEGADFSSARCSRGTRWPETFDPRRAGLSVE